MKIHQISYEILNVQALCTCAVAAVVKTPLDSVVGTSLFIAASILCGHRFSPGFAMYM